MNSFVILVVLKQKSRPNKNRNDMESSVSFYEGMFAQIIVSMEFFTDE